MPTFCRHNRLVENCTICSRRGRVDLSAAGGGPARGAAAPARRERSVRTGSGRPRKPPRAQGGALTVRRLERAPEDGYEHELLPGLRASSDAARLATELVAAAVRIEALATAAPVALEEVLPGAPPAAELVAGAATPESRFDRAYERLARTGMKRPERVRGLIEAHARGLLTDISPWTLRLADAQATDLVLIAAKRALGIGDPVLLQRRLRMLCAACGVPVAAAEDALGRWAATDGGPGEDLDQGRLAAALAAVGLDTQLDRE